MTDDLAPPISYRPAENAEVRKLREDGWKSLPVRKRAVQNYTAHQMYEAMAHGWLVSIGVRQEGALRCHVVESLGYGNKPEGDKEPTAEWLVEVTALGGEKRRLRVHIRDITAVNRAI